MGSNGQRARLCKLSFYICAAAKSSVRCPRHAHPPPSPQTQNPAQSSNHRPLITWRTSPFLRPTAKRTLKASLPFRLMLKFTSPYCVATCTVFWGSEMRVSSDTRTSVAAVACLVGWLVGCAFVCWVVAVASTPASSTPHRLTNCGTTLSGTHARAPAAPPPPPRPPPAAGRSRRTPPSAAPRRAPSAPSRSRSGSWRPPSPQRAPRSCCTLAGRAHGGPNELHGVGVHGVYLTGEASWRTGEAEAVDTPSLGHGKTATGARTRHDADALRHDVGLQRSFSVRSRCCCCCSIIGCGGCRSCKRSGQQREAAAAAGRGSSSGDSPAAAHTRHSQL